jgi:phosphatidylglycerol:prolipoprotein diacylglycerol transferase
MKPILFEWGPIRIGSYGVLLASAFIGSILITNREFRKNNENLDLAWDIYILAIVGGLVGSRALYLVERWRDVLSDPFGTIVSSAGFSVIGGYVLAITLCAIRFRRANVSFLRMGDLCAPGMTIGYAIGRLGCITAGDGCYGLPTLSWVGMTFPNGLVSTLSAQNPLLRQKFVQLFPNLSVPTDIAVHPTPLYESLSQWVLLAILLATSWNMGKGRRFAFFLLWFGTSRFWIEFIRLNPVGPWGLTSDQWLSLGAFGAGLILLGISRFIVVDVPADASAIPGESPAAPIDAAAGKTPE